jgi:hypothetical protein
MKGRSVFWGIIASFSLGLVVRYCYFNWDNQGVRAVTFYICIVYCLFTAYWNMLSDSDGSIPIIFVPLKWPLVFIGLINKLADKYLTIKEKETNK